MDPDACLERWAFAVADGDNDEASKAWRDLARWLRNGGFEPSAWKGPKGEKARHEFRSWVPA